ncbi:hypothetical protein EGW08_003444 [Elysia chlorotica]|uniref:snRNA-activating protein complex subunit 3 n=1 Tax=Elysia chlorotica TaxID=188477 RepID=A0A3S1BI31_ELYCH|nr:hypothetical protein EGW08_003444 [Elysia chlorotica]
MHKGKRKIEESELVNPREFMSYWGLEAHEATRVKPADSATAQINIAAAMGVSADTVAELEDVCGRKALFRGNEPKKKANLYRMNEQPPQSELQCLKHQIAENKKREKFSYDALIKSHMKYTTQDVFMSILPAGANLKEIDPEFRVPEPNVVLTVEVNKCLLQGVYTQTLKERDVYLVLGSQPLTDLRDKIKCSSDRVIPGDYSNMPDVDPQTLQTTGDMFKSSFFLFENVFYNDMRLADNKDYSKPIIAWANDHMPGREFTTEEMSEHTFFDLKIRLGHHYLFKHQGNCEHSVVFTDLRLFNATDLQDVRLYPVLSITRTRGRDVCQSCCSLSAKWCVSNSPLIPCEPTLMCGNCYKSLMYNKDGTKISDFQAYHYVS